MAGSDDVELTDLTATAELPEPRRRRRPRRRAATEPGGQSLDARSGDQTAALGKDFAMEAEPASRARLSRRESSSLTAKVRRPSTST